MPRKLSHEHLLSELFSVSIMFDKQEGGCSNRKNYLGKSALFHKYVHFILLISKKYTCFPKKCTFSPRFFPIGTASRVWSTQNWKSAATALKTSESLMLGAEYTNWAAARRSILQKQGISPRRESRSW